MNTRQAIIVVDLAFGDCGKGTIVDFLTREAGAHTVVRFNGGPQAAHNVVTPEGQHHTFSQFGSGTFVPGVRTLLSRFMMIEPYAMLNEAAHLAQLGIHDPLARLVIDRRCPVITPPHQAANRLVEIARGDRAFGTCGMGIGQTMQDIIDHPRLTLFAGDLYDRAVVKEKLAAFRDLKIQQLRSVLTELRDEPRARQSIDTLLNSSWMDAAADNYAAIAAHTRIADKADVDEVLRSNGSIIFEGAQGVLLDETFGFHPHTTWSNTTFANADTLLDEMGYADRRTRIGVLRSYFTRHGAGPFVTEDPALRPILPEPHNGDAGWQGRFRVGTFDAVAARYALAVCGQVDALAITHMDQLERLPKHICNAYEANDLHADDGFFNRINGKIVGIQPCRTPTSASAEQLTRALFQCRPVSSPFSNANPETFLARLQTELQTPIGILSSGPTALDKKIISHGECDHFFTGAAAAP